jgi:hypothetical protein
MPWIYVGDKSDEGQDASLRVEMGNISEMETERTSA